MKLKLSISVLAQLLGFACACQPVLSHAATINITSPSQIASAAAGSSPGDEIVLADGFYSNAGAVSFATSGSSGSPVTLRAATPGGVVLSGTVALTVTGNWLVVSGLRFDSARNTAGLLSLDAAFDTRVTQCAFINSGSTASVFDRMLRIENGAARTRIDHCFFQGNLATGVEYLYVTGNEIGSDHLFDHNYLRDTQRITTNGRETIKIGNSQKYFGDRDARVVVQYNLWDNTVGDNELISVKASNNTVRFNTFLDALKESGLQIRGGSNNVVEGNYLYRTAEGIKLMGENGVVFNNYLEDTTRTASASAQLGAITMEAGTSNSASADVQAAQRFLVAYNTVVRTQDFSSTRLAAGIALGPRKLNNVGNPLDYRDANPADNLFTNNIITSAEGILVSDTASDNTTYTSNYLYATGTATYGVTGGGLVQTDPGLVDDGTVFRLTSSSAGRGAATVTGAGIDSTDIEGQVRDGSPDVGADEYATSLVSRSPLRPADVGPAWIGGPTTGFDSVPHVSPDSLAAVVVAPTSVYLSWTDKSSDETGFEIRCRPATSYWRVLTSTAAVSATNSVVRGLQPNTTYSFQVRAIGAREASAWSAPVNVTTYDAYLESSGDVTVEAEHPYATYAGTSPYTAWTEGSSSIYTGFVGSYLEASSETGTPVWSDAPGMDYRIRFSTAGTYNVWIRLWADSGATDSLHWGYNGTFVATFGATTYGSWIWRKLGTVTVASGDNGTVNLRRRERNLRLDRLYLTTSATNPSTLSSGQGPSESAVSFFPAIASLTKTDVVNEGSAYTYTATATGNPTPTYQWRKDGTDISGATSSSYVIGAASASDQAAYSVSLTNSSGTVTSPNVDLAVRPAPAFTTQPSGGTYNFGSTITLTFAAAPSWDRTIQWRKNGVNIPGAIGSTYQITKASIADAADYSVRLTNAAGNVTSINATITISTSNPGTPQYWVESGGSSTFEAELYDTLYTGTGYAQWSSGTNSAYMGFLGSYLEASSDSGTPVWADAPGMDYNIKFTTTGTYNVWVRLWADSGSTDSMHWGYNGSFSATFGATTYGSWIWRKLGTVSVGSAGVGVLNLRRRERNLRLDRVHLTTSSTNPSTIDSGDGPAASSRSGLTPTISVQPTGAALAAGSNYTLSVTAANASSYQWHVFTMASTTGPAIRSPISGANSSSYTITSLSGSNTGVYAVAVANAFGTLQSTAVPVILSSALGGALQARTILVGGSTLFSVAPDEPVSLIGTTTFQWRKNGTAISGATSASHQIANAVSGDAGGYSVVITMSGVSFETNAATLTVN